MHLHNCNYKRPAWALDAHSQTILPALFRKVKGVHFDRERIHTYDQDFLDLDWSKVGSSKLAILSHGLEGNSSQAYILGMVKTINQEGWDALAWNYRSCSGEMNNKVRFYRADSAEDIDCVVRHAIKRGYREIMLIGFSLGGAFTIKLLSQLGSHAYPEISKALVFSVPCDLISSVKVLSKGLNRRLYHRRFIEALRFKLTQKIRQFPDLLSHIDIHNLKTFEDFDNIFTAPLCGYKDAHEYYKRGSCKDDISLIRVPTLIVNAQNDPFLAEDSHPTKECRNNKWVHLELPKDGGHVGFMLSSVNGPYWTEQRAIELLKND
jgi:predicted alpha/beta-fold hydrolase